MSKAVKVAISAHRDGYERNTFWVKVTATPVPSEAEHIEEISIWIYQMDKEQGGALIPYEMENGKEYGWELAAGDVVVVVVLYWDKRFSEQVAAQGVWWSDGEYLRKSDTLQGRSKVFA